MSEIRLIDANALLKSLKSGCENCSDANTNWCEHCCKINDFEDLIDNAPTITQTIITEFKGCDNCELERPKGEWKYAYYPNINKEIYYCSNCNVAFPIKYSLAENINPINKELTIIQKDSRFNFCPCCGADMRGEDK